MLGEPADRGNIDGAIAVYDASLAKVARQRRAAEQPGDDLRAQGNLTRAAEYAARAHKAAPKAPAIADTYGWILFKQGKTDEALPLLREAYKGLPDNAEVQYHLAAVLASKGEKAEALSLVSKAVAGALPADKKADAEKLLEQLSK